MKAVLAVVVLTTLLSAPASASVDPPPTLMVDQASAPVITQPTSGSVMAVSRTASRDFTNAALAVPNTACWRFEWDKEYRNHVGQTMTAPYFGVEWCYRNYVQITGAIHWCGSTAGFLDGDACDTKFSGAGYATRKTFTDWSPSWGLGWFKITYDIDLNLTLGPGPVTGVLSQNLT
jgi:hypothetical protein